jgi:subtilase family serine protease
MRARLSILACIALVTGLFVVQPAAGASTKPSKHVDCGGAAPMMAQCAAHVIVDGRTGKPAATPGPTGLSPAQLQSAYKFGSGGSGKTVAIVDAYHDPYAANELATYRAQFNLPVCAVNTCFKQVDQRGGTSYPAYNAGWAEEIALDIQMVSAICPSCNILLVEADSNSLANLGAAVNTAAGTSGVVAVSNSYGAGEFSSEGTYANQYYNHPGVAVTASSGDSGFGASFPAAANTVIAVGGTRLSTASNLRGWSESAWSGAGSGCSAVISKPSWQHDSGCSKRMIADVSAVADPNTGVSVYSTPAGGWVVFGGTSVSAPIIASMYALGGHSSASWTYANATSLFDVTSGSNGSGRCKRFAAYYCNAVTGYDGPTGLGTPNGTGAF